MAFTAKSDLIAYYQKGRLGRKAYYQAKKYRFITACLLILMAFLLFNIFNRNTTIETFNTDAATKEEIAVYDYEIVIVDIEKKEPGFISVKLGVALQVGAHNPLGYDELVYRVDSSGNKELAGYEHLKNYDVPERF